MSGKFSTSKKLATFFVNLPEQGSVRVQQTDASKPAVKLTRAIQKALDAFRLEYYGEGEGEDDE